MLTVLHAAAFRHERLICQNVTGFPSFTEQVQHARLGAASSTQGLEPPAQVADEFKRLIHPKGYSLISAEAPLRPVLALVMRE